MTKLNVHHVEKLAANSTALRMPVNVALPVGETRRNFLALGRSYLQKMTQQTPHSRTLNLKPFTRKTECLVCR